MIQRRQGLGYLSGNSKERTAAIRNGPQLGIFIRYRKGVKELDWYQFGAEERSME